MRLNKQTMTLFMMLNNSVTVVVRSWWFFPSFSRVGPSNLASVQAVHLPDATRHISVRWERLSVQPSPPQHFPLSTLYYSFPLLDPQRVTSAAVAVSFPAPSPVYFNDWCTWAHFKSEDVCLVPLTPFRRRALDMWRSVDLLHICTS